MYSENKKQLTVLFRELRGKEPTSADLDALASRIEALGPTAQRALAIRYGLDGEEPRNLEEAAKKMGVTRERVRQLTEKALDQLKRRMTMGETEHAAQWAVTVDGNVEYYPSFKEAVDAFAKEVMRHMDEWPDCYEDCMPVCALTFYGMWPEQRPVSDEEVLAYMRMKMACQPLGIKGSLRIVPPDRMPFVFGKPEDAIAYHTYLEDVGRHVGIHVAQGDGSVSMVIHVDIEGTRYLFDTNAVFFTRDDIEYHFHSNQMVITSSERGRCGAECSIDISLRKVA